MKCCQDGGTKERMLFTEEEPPVGQIQPSRLPVASRGQRAWFFFYLSIVMSGTGQGKMLKNSERVKVVRISLEGG